MDFEELTFAPYDESEHKHFILDSWLKSQRGGWFSKGAKKEDFFTVQQCIIEALLKEATATLATVEDTFLGYIVHDEDTLHYLYVKFAYRRQGIGKALIDQANKAFAYCSSITDEPWKRAWIEGRMGLDTSFYAALRYAIGRENQGPVFMFGT